MISLLMVLRQFKKFTISLVVELRQKGLTMQLPEHASGLLEKQKMHSENEPIISVIIRYMI